MVLRYFNRHHNKGQLTVVCSPRIRQYHEDLFCIRKPFEIRRLVLLLQFLSMGIIRPLLHLILLTLLTTIWMPNHATVLPVLVRLVVRSLEKPRGVSSFEHSYPQS